MINGKIDWATVPYCEVDERKQEQCRLAHGDLVISRTGANAGAAAYVANPPSGSVFAGYLVRFRTDPTLADSRFLSYVLQSEIWANYVSNTRTGSAQPQLNAVLMGDFEFELPQLAEQQRIAKVLGALDDLIDTNQRLADQTLSLARVLTSQAAGSVVVLAELAEAAPFRTVTPAGESAHYSLPAFDAGALPERIDGGAIKSNKILLESNVVLISRLNPHIPRVWSVYPEAGVMSVASTEFVPIRGLDVSTEEVYALVSSDTYLAQLSSRVTGTTGSHQRVDKRALFDLVVPDLRRVAPESRQAIRELVQEAHLSRVMCSTLRRTRDELLPLLMSGKIRVKPEAVMA
jgi:type I restriction enzyme, S subunit